MPSPTQSVLLFLPHLDVSGGLGVHCRLLLTALNAVPSAFHFAVVSPADPSALFPTTGLEAFDRTSVDVRRFTFRSLAVPTGFNLAGELDPILTSVVDELQPSLVYGSYYTGMRSPPCPQVVTFHDAGFLENPAGFGATAVTRRQSLEAIRPAIDLIHCISGDARDRICAHLPWNAEGTEVVWHALPDSVESLAMATAMPAESITLALQSARELKPYFFLPVGAATGFNRVRKNVPNAIRAFRKLPAGIANLVIAGTAVLTDKMLAELLPPDESGMLNGECWVAADGRVRIVPTLERIEFLAAMRQSAAVVYPSRYEGFGLPTLEAFALGVPLIASRATSIPEIVGDAGLLIDPDDVPGFTNVMQRLLNEFELRKELILRGHERVKLFTLAAMGQGMLRCFERVLSTPYWAVPTP